MHDVQSQLFKMDDATDWVARRSMAVRAPRAATEIHCGLRLVTAPMKLLRYAAKNADE
jgi:hypothetical protein